MCFFISWKGAPLFRGGVFFRWGGGGFIFKCRGRPMGALVLMGGGSKKIVGWWGRPHPCKIRHRLDTGYLLCLKLVRIMLETWNLVHKYKQIRSFRKYTFQHQGSLNFADVRIFGKNSTFTQSNSMGAVLGIFQFCFQFLQDKKLPLMKM